MEDDAPKIICLPYVKGISEKIERICTPLGVKAAFRPVRTIRKTLMKVKTPIPEAKKKSVVYEVPCKECDGVYIGETKRTLKIRLGEHKSAVKRGDPKNGIAVHAHETKHAINWDEAKVRRCVNGFWQRKTTEAIHIQRNKKTMNLDRGLCLPSMWNPILNPP
ncbi:MAG: GIY-YIG nuclease family protein [Alphaproteobacteria bacterium]|nr:GIY-YIG nuclease family protein [Alphaproteobacteria bacterium]